MKSKSILNNIIDINFEVFKILKKENLGNLEILLYKNKKILVSYNIKCVVCLGFRKNLLIFGAQKSFAFLGLETEILTIATGNCPLPKGSGFQEFLYKKNSEGIILVKFKGIIINYSRTNEIEKEYYRLKEIYSKEI